MKTLFQTSEILHKAQDIHGKQKRKRCKQLIYSVSFLHPSFFVLSFTGYKTVGKETQVELEGIEPSSKQGSHTLSTRLFQTAVFVTHQDLDHQVHPYPLKVSPTARGCRRLFPILLHRESERFRKMAFSAMSRSNV